ncbi:nuclear factor of activated T-cells 5 isoform X2 [Hemicordylus capensis]|uniref:nuclear factor of activated T-cells 5 isoform X2 n=1 Tax=Hemicordylus capensis TaxID=884348 RepID=UPI0023042224|nr:nuclear factor of activated T-cells 5 isoform X2 [Hemicordylus capensis]
MRPNRLRGSPVPRPARRRMRSALRGGRSRWAVATAATQDSCQERRRQEARPPAGSPASSSPPLSPSFCLPEAPLSRAAARPPARPRPGRGAAMPSDFISLLSADLDLESPKSLYSKESVYDLLPKELQLPPSRELSVASMSQTSGGEAGSPPPGVVAADASSAPSSSSMGGACSSFTTSSSPTIYSTSVTDSKAMQVESCSSAMGVSNRGVSDKQLTNNTVQQQQATPKRHTVLYISPPPEDLLDNSRMSCQDEGCGLESEQSCSMWMEESPSNFSNMSTSSYNDNTEVPRKSRKRNPKQRPGIKRRDCEESTMDIFDADSAKAPHYVLSQLSTDSKSNSKAGNGTSEAPKSAGGKKSPMLCGQYPGKSEGKELKIVVQPETQHRARYLTEGSRGSVKDRTQQGFPTVKLEGHNEPVTLQIFVGNDSGRVKPHGFYQACRVTGRNTTPCKEVDIEGTTVIEVGLDPSNSMTLAVDCVGILKLRNADVEARIGIAGSKKKSTRARLVFRVNILRKDGSTLTLQMPSSPILCTQPAGVPEILKKSLHSCSVKGEEEVFLIGKNFLKGTKVIFQENVSDENSWKAEAEIDMELFHQNHLIVKVPPYHDQQITAPVSVGIYVMTNAGRSHDIQPFTYTPDTSGTLSVNVKQEISSPTQPCSFDEAIKVNASGCNLDKAANVIGSSQAALETNMSSLLGSGTFSSSTSHLASEGEKQQQQLQPEVYSPEVMPALQTQDMAQPGSFPAVSAPSQLQNSDTLLQQAAQFPSRESQPREVLQPDAGVMTLSQLTEASQQQSPLQESAQALQQQISSNMFSSASGVNQLQNTIQQLQAGSFQSSTASSSGNVDLVQQVMEVRQQLNSVLFSGSDNEDVQEQLNAEIFQQVSQIQNGVSPGLFSPSEPVHSRAEELLSARTENGHPQPEDALSSQQQQQQQQQAMETSAAMVMEMQQGLCQAASQMQSELFSSSSSGNGNLQQPPVYQQAASHMMGRLSTSEDMQMQCELFSSPGVPGSEATTPPQQQQGPTSGSAMFQSPGPAEGEEVSDQAEQMQNSVFQGLVPMQHSGESQPQVSLFPSSENLMAVQGRGAQQQQQQQGGALFQQGGEMMSLQAGSFLQQGPHSQAQLFHSQSPLGEAQNVSQETPSALFHGQSAASSSEQLQPPPMFHSQSTLGVLQSSSVVQDQPQGNLFLPQNSMSGSVTQEEQMPFFTAQNSMSSLQAPASAEQQQQQPPPPPSFQQQPPLSHLQSPMLTQEQPQQQGMFQPQVSLGSLPPSGVPPSQQGAMFQSSHSMVALQTSTPSQEQQQQQQQQQNLRFGSQSTMGSMTPQKQNLMFNPSPGPMASQEQQQQSQSLFHPPASMAPMSQEQQPMQFQSQSPGSTQAEPQQPALFHPLVQGPPSSQEQPITLFISSASMSALQSSMSQQDLQQPSLYSPQSSMAGMQGAASPPQQQQQQQQQQQAALFHSAPGGAMNQLQNSSASSRQTSGIFLFSMQDNQLLPSGPATMSDQMIAISQPQVEAQPSVTTLLSQQMSESPQLSTNQNMKKIDELLVSLQSQGSSNMAGSF